MSKRPQDTSAEEPDGGNPHIRFRGGPRQGDRPGLLNKALILVLPWLAFAAGSARAASDPGFTLSAGAEDFDRYFPSYLANGYFSTMTAPRGTEGNLAYMVAFMDYAKDDE